MEFDAKLSRLKNTKMAKKKLPPLGIVYILKQAENIHWIAVDYETYERIGTVRNTRTLQNLFKDEIQTYLDHGYILYEKLDKKQPS